MDQIAEIINASIHWAPFIIFGLMLLAGCGFPVSEDAMLFISAVLAANNPDHLVPIFISMFAGAYFSDFIAYGLGRKLGPKLWKFHFFEKIFPRKKVSTIYTFYKKYGALTLIVGRFIPFGVRNALFFTGGMVKTSFIKFALFDCIACTISTFFFFTIYYHFGNAVIDYVRKGNIALFVSALIAVIIIYAIKKKRAKSKSVIETDK